MINIDNLKYLLESLNFKNKNDVYSKHYKDNDAFLKVDLKKQEIIYPEEKGLTINERQTCNFKANENFVVFECIHRLLEKGYKPEHIELEPKWKLGHGASGGRADILIKDNAGKPLLIIECKTPGREFDKAWRNTLQDGDQLFGYVEQIKATEFLCVYSSDFENDILSYKSHIIAHRDNDKYLTDNPLFKSYRDATDRKERFAVWRETYKLDFTTKGIFEDNIQPYHIGKDKYTIDDLHSISAADQQKKYHEFATILRQHNVSGRENAFDKLVNLFLCKLVDETENPDELKFYWKGVAYDTHFDLLDRLQQLYQAGMGKFLGEDITYINQNDVNNALRFIRQNPDATQRAVWNLFVQQKFFTNNDFSLIDVHNEKLFYQNAEVLLKILQMWQDIRLTGDNNHNQFLGDMFEGFLDQGVKQSEGQYFTPMPICRFILMSLPLASLVKGSPTPPKAIDYACGAGHFLNELALQIKPLVEEHKQSNLDDYHKAIYGMEKEYRLSKVAKVSAFMYGQQEINICYGDALINQHPAFPEIKDNSFDLLVANPPFSVRGFLETLPEEERASYTLTDSVDKLDTNNSIETFFVERAKQLLKVGGVAGIILPISVLSNGGRIYSKTREIFLQYFDIISIVAFGGNTFGKTGTSTAVMFLRRKSTTPDTAVHFSERVEQWFTSDDNQPVYQDAHLIEQYAAHIGVAAADYKSLLSGTPNAALLAHDTFDQYRTVFDGSTEIVNLKKQKGFKARPKAEQETELTKRFLAFVSTIERDKLYHFVLASQQTNPVLIVKSPEDNKDKKQFLGFYWSDSKGDEGIKIIKDAHGHHLTPLYDETDRNKTGKINRCIADNFDGKLTAIPEELSELAATSRLVDMLDFSRVTFEKQISLVTGRRFEFKSKWPLVKLGEIAEIKKGKSITQKDVQPGNVKVVAGGVDFAYHHDQANRPKNTITISASGANAGYVNYWAEEIFASDCSTVRGTNDEHTEYLFNALQSRQEEISSFARGAAQPHVYPKDVEQLLIPTPDPSTQRKIVIECQSVNTEVTAAQTTIDTARQTIERQVEAIYASNASRQEIDKLSLSVQYGLSEKMNEAGIGYKIFRMNEIIQGHMADNGSMKCADISADEFAKYRLNKGDLLFNRTNGSLDHVGKTGMFDLDGDYCFASYLVRVVPDQKQILSLFLNLMMSSKEFRREAVGKAVKSAGQNNINATTMRNIKVPVPPLAEQKRLVAKVEKLEKQIAEAQAVIAATPARKQAIMQKYL